MSGEMYIKCYVPDSEVLEYVIFVNHICSINKYTGGGGYKSVIKMVNGDIFKSTHTVEAMLEAWCQGKKAWREDTAGFEL